MTVIFGRAYFLPTLLLKDQDFIMTTREDKEKAIQYLFGELSETERDTLEERIFSDEDFSLFLEATEKDLVDEYVRGELESALHNKFEKNYLISERRRENVRTASILQKKLFTEKDIVGAVVVEAKPTIWESLVGLFQIPKMAWAGGLAAILIAVLLIGFVVLRQSNKPIDVVKDENSNRENQFPTPIITPEVSPTAISNSQNNDNVNIDKTENTNRIVPANKTKQPEKTPTPSVAPKEKREDVSPPSQPQIFIATLLPPLRSSANPILKIPSASQTVQLRLFDNFSEKYEKLIVELNDNSGNSVWSKEIKTGKSLKSITVNIPNSLFKAGNHEIAVSGKKADGRVEEINFYNFVVQRK